jgi:hypothetical protein
MFSLKHSATGAHSYALFDIGASGIGVGLAVCNAKKAELLWYTRMEYAFVRGADPVRYEKSMYAALLEVGMTMVSEGVRVAKHHPLFNVHGLTVTCIMAPPWCLGTVIEQVHSGSKPFEITHGIIDKMHAAMFTSFLDTPECIEWRASMGDPELLEQCDVHVLLDGYPVLTYEKRVVHEFTLRTYMALVTQSVAEHVQDIVHRVVPNHTISITSSTRLFTQSLIAADAAKPAEDALLVEVGGQVTSVSIVRNGSLCGSRIVPYGTHDLLLAIAPDATTSKEAHDAYTVYLKQRTANDHPHSEGYEKAGAQWQAALLEEMVILSQGVTLPKKALLSASGFQEPYTEFLARPTIVPGVRTEQSFDVVLYPPISDKNDQKSSLGSNTDERLQFFCTLLMS